MSHILDSYSNNGFFNQSSNYYNQRLNNEIAELQHMIVLPMLPPHKFCMKIAAAYDELGLNYEFAEAKYGDVEGNMYITMMTPLIENGESTEMEFGAPSTENILGEGLHTVEYKESNFVRVMIPRDIVLNFRKKIPVGTKFSITHVGGSSDIAALKVSSVIDRGEGYDPNDYKLKSMVEKPYGEEFIAEVEEDLMAAREEYEMLLEEAGQEADKFEIHFDEE